MTIAKILCPLRGDDKAESVLAHAAAVAHLHHAHVEVLHCRARASDMIPYGVVVPSSFREQIKAQAREIADAEEKALVAGFERLLPELGLTRVDGPPTDAGATASWHEEEGRMADVIKPWGRLADLIVVAKPDRDNLGANTLRTALFGCGRPVMICPDRPGPPAGLGRRIAVAWNGSMEASRAVALSLGLLRGAEEVIVLDGGSQHPAVSGQALQRYLSLNGIDAGLQRIDAEDEPGEVLLATAPELGADTLLMGAYSHSRERETVFGGATQHVVDHAEMPVVMVH
ncbi:MAG TPA: universal stress protein [Thermohalobaculum sp.]|nr:universal stress protein [Thermohalobaculum sp.]